MRFVDGKVQKIRGEAVVFSAPSTPPHFIMPWESTGGYRWIYAGEDEIWYEAGGSSTEITRGVTVAGDDPYTTTTRPLWTGGILHTLPILNLDNGVDPPQSWNTTDLRMEDLPNWPANTTCKVIRPYNNFLVALNITKSANNYPQMVKWSHPADPGLVPDSWDEADPARLAGETVLSETTGVLVDCLPLRGQNIIYKNDSIWTMRLTNSQFVFAFDKISGAVGALAPHCIAEFYGQHVVVGENDIVLFDGRTPQSIVNSRMRKFFFDALDGTYFDKTYVTINRPRREVWVCYVTADSPNDYINQAIVWNWEENTWTVKDLPEIAFSSYGDVIEGANETFASVGGSSYVTAGSWVGGTATLTLNSASGFAIGDTVDIAGVNPAGYNGTYTLTGQSGNDISYALAGNPGTYVSGGTAQETPFTTFDQDFGPFNSSGTSPANTQLLHARALATTAFLEGDEGYQSNGTNYVSYLERTGLPIAGNDRQGQPRIDPASVKFIRAVFPKISAQTNITLKISVGVQEFIDGPVTWEGPYDFITNQDFRIDTCLQGRYFAIKIEDEDNNLPWELTGYVVDLEIIAEQ
jgi:hypothetical protein